MNYRKATVPRLSRPLASTAALTTSSRVVPSGGTLASYLAVLDLYSFKEVIETTQPWALSPVPGADYQRATDALRVRAVPELGTLATSINGSQDRAIVHRSWGLYANGKFYGKNFRFAEYLRVRNAVVGVLLNLAIVMGVLLSFFGPFR